jgi:hypothetical protein
MGFNRNIITAKDVENFAAAHTEAAKPRTLATAPPAVPAKGAPTADDFLTQVLKYIPLEIIGLYLAIAGILDANVKTKSAHALAVGLLLVGSAALACVYDWRILNVQRWQQILMTGVALAVYVFAAGGWFATTSWYQPWFASIAVPAFAIAVALWKLPPLPQPPAK